MICVLLWRIRVASYIKVLIELCAYTFGSKRAALAFAGVEKRAVTFCDTVERVSVFYGSKEAASGAVIDAEFSKRPKSDLFIRALLDIIDRPGTYAKKAMQKSCVHSAVRIKRAARAVRSAVRQTFAAKKAAKADSGGSDGSDPEPRHRQHHLAVTLSFSAVSVLCLGGAAK